MQKIEANQRRIFIGMEIGRGKCGNDVLLTMSKDFKDKRCEWIKENYGVNFKFEGEQTHESTVPMMIDKYIGTTKEVESHVINELKRRIGKLCGLKKVITTVKSVMKMVTKETDQC